MRSLLVLVCGVLAACAADPPARQQWEPSRAEARGVDRCVTLLCATRACGLYFCEDVLPGRIVRAQAVAPLPRPAPTVEPFPTPANPQRYWGNAQGLPGDAQPIFIIPWNQSRPKPQAEEEDGGKDKRTYVKHHVFPRQFEMWFKGKGINIHDWTLVVEEPIHKRIHAGAQGGPWNAAWDWFIENNPKATQQDIHVYALKLILRFELSGLVVPYRRKMLPVFPLAEEDPY